MKVAFDHSFLIFLSNRKAAASVDRAAERVDGLIDKLSAKKAKVIIPTPVLAELLMAGHQPAKTYIDNLKAYACFQIRPFDERAAVELATRFVGSKKNRKRFKNVAGWNKIKFDRQIVAIAKVQGATAVYSDDKQVRAFAEECGMEAFKLADLDIPPKQTKLFVTEEDDSEDEETKPKTAKPEPPELR